MFRPEVDLVAELCWLELLRSEDDVAARVLHVVSRHVPRKGKITFGKIGQLTRCVGGEGLRIQHKHTYGSEYNVADFEVIYYRMDPVYKVTLGKVLEPVMKILHGRDQSFKLDQVKKDKLHVRLHQELF
jgi:hypothetical protein